MQVSMVSDRHIAQSRPMAFLYQRFQAHLLKSVARNTNDRKYRNQLKPFQDYS